MSKRVALDDGGARRAGSSSASEGGHGIGSRPRGVDFRAHAVPMARCLSSHRIRRSERTFRSGRREAPSRSGAGAEGPGNRRNDRGSESAKKKLGVSE